MMDWNDVRLFLAIARAGTLSAAAPELGLSQPTAGRRLRGFEEAIGAPLFQRTPAGLQLTSDGHTIFENAERIEAEVFALQRRAGADASELSGDLRISTPEWFASAALVGPLTSFTVDHPSVTIELLGETRLFDLDRREADLVFRFQRFEGADVVQRKFVAVAYGSYATDVYIARHGPPSLGDGEGHRLIAMDAAHGGLADVGWLRARFPKATFSLRSNSRDLQAAACANHGGIAVIPRVLGERLKLTRLDLGEDPPGRDVWLGYHADLRKLARLRAVVEHLTTSVTAL